MAPIEEEGGSDLAMQPVTVQACKEILHNFAFEIGNFIQACTLKYFLVGKEEEIKQTDEILEDQDEDFMINETDFNAFELEASCENQQGELSLQTEKDSENFWIYEQSQTSKNEVIAYRSRENTDGSLKVKELILRGELFKMYQVPIQVQEFLKIKAERWVTLKIKVFLKKNWKKHKKKEC